MGSGGGCGGSAVDDILYDEALVFSGSRVSIYIIHKSQPRAAVGAQLRRGRRKGDSARNAGAGAAAREN